ncbi:MAG: Wzz/FepE/Etk N-terminal domain-containing protein [Chloroflexia bacterium]
MSASEVWQVLRRRWWVIAVVAAAAALGAFLYSLAQPPLYRARAELVVLPNRADWGLRMYLEAQMRTFPAVLRAFPREKPAGLPPDLGERMYVQTVPEEGRVVIEVDDGDPARAAEYANTLGRLLARWVQEHAPQLGQERIYVSTLLPAEVPGAPSSPRYKVNTAAGAVLGLVLGLPLAFLWDFLDDTIADPGRASARLGVEVWPALTFPRDGLAVLHDPAGEAAVAFQRLYTWLRLAGVGPPERPVLAVAGLGREDVPPAFLSNLGAAVAQEGGSVLLLDADLAHPALHEPFGLPASPGLGDLAAREELPTRRETALAGLYLIPAGESPSPAARAPALRRLAGRLPDLARTTGFLLVRLPDPIEVPEARLVAEAAGTALLVARAGHARLRRARRALEALAGRVQVVGLALWSVER